VGRRATMTRHAGRRRRGDLLVWGSDLVLNSSARFGPPPNPGRDRWSGSAPTLNPRPNFGPVREGSGSDRSSEPNRGIPTLYVYVDIFPFPSLSSLLPRPQPLFDGHHLSISFPHRTLYSFRRFHPQHALVFEITSMWA
jgi:hypothetical protein